MENNNKRYFLIVIVLIVSKFLTMNLLGEFGIYIIVPSLFLFLAILFYHLIDINNNRKNFINSYEVLSVILFTSIFYLIVYFVLGIPLGYSKNLLGTSKTLLYINIFRKFSTIVALTYLKHLYVNKLNVVKGLKETVVYIFLFALLEANSLNVIHILSSLANVFDFLFNRLFILLLTNTLSFYLIRKGGFLPAIMYESITNLPLLFLAVLPNVDNTMLTILTFCLVLITYLIVEYKIERVSNINKKKYREKTSLLGFLIVLGLNTSIVLFYFGVFPIVPVSIITNSMYPEILPGDLVLVNKNYEPEDIVVGTIIHFKKENYSVVHRVIEIETNGKETFYITKGDNNQSKDFNPVMTDSILGIVKHKIPYFGYPSYVYNKYFNNNGDVSIETGR